MLKLLTAFIILVCSGCASAPIEPDAEKIMAGAAMLKVEPLSEITIEKIQIPSLAECGEMLCLSNIDFKKLEFEIAKAREKLKLRHISEESRTQMYNELVNTLGKEWVIYAYSNWRNELLTKEVQELRFTSGLQKWVERLGFGIVVCLFSGICVP